MNQMELERRKLFFELIKYVSDLKENSDEIREYSKEMFTYARDTFEKQNNKVFDINLFILIRLYKKEYNALKQERGQFSLNEYYDFVESIDLPDNIYEMYMKMPKMLSQDKIISYITDMPSFLSMVRI